MAYIIGVTFLQSCHENVVGHLLEVQMTFHCSSWCQESLNDFIDCALYCTTPYKLYKFCSDEHYFIMHQV